MKSKMIFGIVIIMFLPALAFAGELHNVLKNYNYAVERNDAKTMFQLIDTTTKDFYLKIKNDAIYLTSDKLKNEPILNKIFIIQIRATCEVEQLEKMTDYEFYYFMSTNDSIGISNSFKQIVGEDEVINGAEGKLDIIKDGKKSNIGLYFAKEKDEWKLNIYMLIKIANVNFDYLVKNKYYTEKELLNQILVGDKNTQIPNIYFEPLLKE